MDGDINAVSESGLHIAVSRSRVLLDRQLDWHSQSRENGVRVNSLRLKIFCANCFR